MTADILQLVLATANKDKALEIRAILTESLGDNFELVPRPESAPDVEETGTTLVENARLKAEALCLLTSCAAVADDTGLEVDALDGEPGVYSARFAGPNATYADNVQKLHQSLVGETNRQARFRTVALVTFPDGTELMAEGAVEGTIAVEPKGDGGFGYDPLFIPDGSAGRSFAEMTLAEKDAISHRGRAFRALATMLAAREQ